eukprot:366521-Chlamydomonas_euryale.AAC.13
MPTSHVHVYPRSSRLRMRKHVCACSQKACVTVAFPNTQAAGAPVGRVPVGDLARDLFDAFAARDATAVASRLAAGVTFRNRASMPSAAPLTGAAPVAQLYASLLAAAPRGASFVVDDVCEDERQRKAAVAWYVDLGVSGFGNGRVGRLLVVC